MNSRIRQACSTRSAAFPTTWPPRHRSSGGYPWTVIELERRSGHMAALDETSSRENIVPFSEFVASSMRRDAELIKAGQRPARATASRSRPSPVDK